MIKAIVRFFVVLLVACLLGLGLYWIVQNNSSLLGTNVAQGEGLGREGFSRQRNQPAGVGTAPGSAPRSDFTPRAGRPERGFDGGGFGFSGILRNIGIFLGMTLAVFGIQKGMEWIRRRPKLQPVKRI